MGRKAKLAPINTAEGWRLNVPAKLTESGKRERYFYRSRALAEAAAKDFRDKRESFGAQTRLIGPSLAEQATAAAALLEPYGVTLLDVARRFVEAAERDKASSVIEEALAEFRRRKEDRSAKQVQAYRLMADRLIEDFGGRPLSTIRGPELVAHIERHTGGPGAFNQRYRLIAAFWRWAAKPPRQWCDPVEVQHIERKETISGHIETLTAAEAKKLLQTAEKHYPDCALAFAIALFTGMRRQEIERLQPEDFTSDGLTVPALSAKTKRRRFIHMPEPLAAWLKAYPVAETVLPTNWLRKEKAVRRLAGWRVWSDLLDPSEPPDELPKWPENALRHTAASVALAIGKPIETLVFEHGHSGGLTTLRNHYIGVMTKREAIAIQGIGPKGTRIQTIAAA